MVLAEACQDLKRPQQKREGYIHAHAHDPREHRVARVMAGVEGEDQKLVDADEGEMWGVAGQRQRDSGVWTGWNLPCWNSNTTISLPRTMKPIAAGTISTRTTRNPSPSFSFVVDAARGGVT